MTVIPPLRHPQLSVRCPWCHATPGEPCGSHRGRVRRQQTHTARRTAWIIAVAVCPTCQVAPSFPCRDPNARPLDEPHPAREDEAVRTQPPARRPRIEALGEQLNITED